MTPSPSGGGPFLARTSEITVVARGCLAPCGLTSLPSIDRPHPLSAPKHGVDDEWTRWPTHQGWSWKTRTRRGWMNFLQWIPGSVASSGQLIGGVSECPLSSVGLGLGKLYPPQQCLLLCHSLTRSLFSSPCRCCRCPFFHHAKSFLFDYSRHSLYHCVYLFCCGWRSSAIIASGNCIDHASKLGQRCWQQRFTMKTQTPPSPNVSLRRSFPSH
jgi:hypothetical protein